MALNNCTITSASITAAAGTTNLASQTVTITPNSGFVLNAQAFTVEGRSYSQNGSSLTYVDGQNGNSLPSGINSITLSNTTVANEVGNEISVVIDLDNSYAMPSSNATLIFDIDGTAIIKHTRPYSISGTWDAVVGTNVSPSSSSSNAYSGTGAYQSSTTLFTQSFTCAAGYFFENPPSYVLTTGNSTYYNITSTNTFTGSGGNTYLKAVTYTIAYTFPDYSVVGDNIDFTVPNAALIPVTTNKITSYSIPTTNISQYGESRVLRVYGDVGATYSAVITNEDTHYYNFTTLAFQSGSTNSAATIGGLGYRDHLISFPAVTDDDVYTITLSPTSPTTQGITQTNPFTIQQITNVSVTWSLNSASNRSYTSSPTHVKSGPPGVVSSGNQSTVFTLTLTDNEDIVLRRAPLVTDFVQTNIGSNGTTNCDVSLNKISTTPVYSSGMTPVQSLAIYSDNSVYEFGTQSATAVLALDNFINTPPVANSPSTQQIPNNTATTFTLTGTDANSDPLTFAIVSQGSKGTATINSASGVCTYTPSGSLVSGGDSFTFRVNDGYQNSAAATVNVAIASSGSNTPTFNTTWAWNDSEVNNNYSLIGASAFQGSAAYTNSAAAGSSSVTATITDWDLDSIHTGLPSYIDNVGDFTVYWELKYGSTVLAEDVANINTSTSTISNSGSTLNLTAWTMAIPNTHNSGNGLIANGSYTVNMKVKYDNISQ